jgi:demethylmenaquinone methyltransferase / 2-methoxy-6-polyprenyl-1,4-benzoquinol methylase
VEGLTRQAAGPDGTDKRAEKIASMFDAIAVRYDVLNHLLSAGLDRRWRRQAIDTLELSPDAVFLDLCTGTADLALAALRGRGPRARRAIGVDFAREMLKVGQAKVRRCGLGSSIALVRGDAMQVPIGAQAVDAAGMAFGIRNVERPDVSLREAHRVLRPGGGLAILEFGLPHVSWFRRAYLWYFQRVLPAIGRWGSRHGGAYAYLPASVSLFPAPPAFCEALRQAGFAEVRAVPLSFGIVYLYVGRKPR